MARLLAHSRRRVYVLGDDIHHPPLTRCYR